MIQNRLRSVEELPESEASALLGAVRFPDAEESNLQEGARGTRQTD